MSAALVQLAWLLPTVILVGFIYAAMRTGSNREMAVHGLRQAAYIFLGMCALGLVIFLLSRHL